MDDKGNILGWKFELVSEDYYHEHKDNEVIVEDHIVEISEINPMSYKIVGDGSLVNQIDDFGDIPIAFLNTKSVWKKVDKIAYLVPKYLKESESYLK